MKFLMLVLALTTSTGVFAHAATGGKCCYCEIGAEPVSEGKFFNMGCKLWLKDQKNCDVKEIVPQGTDYSAMNLACDGGTLSVGYVGHWNSSEEMVEYLQASIVPVMAKHHVSVTVDNTACSSMNNPPVIVNYIKSLGLSSNQTLTIRGNQLTSVGEWTHLLGQSANFTATVSSVGEKVIYPACKQYEGYNCIQQVQRGQPATCIEKDGRPQVLVCCGVTADITRSNSMKYIWTTQDQCSQQ